MQTPEDYTPWLGLISAALAAIGGWIWRIGRLEQRHEDRLKRLEEEVAEARKKRSERDAEIFARLEEMGRVQAMQSVKIDHIAESTAEIREVIMRRRPGGRRSYDPEAEE